MKHLESEDRIKCESVMGNVEKIEFLFLDKRMKLRWIKWKVKSRRCGHDFLSLSRVRIGNFQRTQEEIPEYCYKENAAYLEAN